MSQPREVEFDTRIGIKLSTAQRELLEREAAATNGGGISEATRDMILAGIASAGADADLKRRAAELREGLAAGRD